MSFPRDRAFWVAAALFVATEVQLLVGTFGGIDRFEGKGFGYRLAVNTVLMLAAPIIWRAVQRGRALRSPVPWWPCVLIISSFLWDALGNSLDLYDSWDPFDNLSHFVTWFLLLWGVGLFLARADVRPRWVLVALITGLGATIAVVWEIGEYFTFIQQGTELSGAYEDTLSDEILGTTGAFCAGLLVHLTHRRLQ
ncbi:MAG: hypothetical protein WA962_13240 [Ornithinimicrobium sp.]